jgi:hypothetical protein
LRPAPPPSYGVLPVRYLAAFVALLLFAVLTHARPPQAPAPPQAPPCVDCEEPAPAPAHDPYQWTLYSDGVWRRVLPPEASGGGAPAAVPGHYYHVPPAYAPAPAPAFRGRFFGGGRGGRGSG